jgi:hypothetical protein
MKKSATRSLRSLLTEAAPIRHLPASVVRQLVGYYGDWRRSRDILNAAGEPNAVAGGRLRAQQRFYNRPSLPNSPSSLRAQ